jgi:hypothetical protein
MEDSGREMLGLAWDMFVSAPPTRTMYILRKAGRSMEVHVEKGVKLGDVVQMLKKHLYPGSSRHNLRMNARRIQRLQAVDQIMDGLRLIPWRLAAMSWGDVRFLMDHVESGRRSQAIELRSSYFRYRWEVTTARSRGIATS